MAIETITVEWAGPKRNNPQYGTMKAGDGRWFDMSLTLANQLAKGQAVQLETYQNEKGYWKARTPQGQPQQAPRPNGSQRPPQPTDGSITKDEAMAVMGVIGRSFQGTGTTPNREQYANMVYNLIMGWRDAEHDLMLAYKQPQPRQPQQVQSGPPEPPPPPFDDSIPF